VHAARKFIVGRCCIGQIQHWFLGKNSTHHSSLSTSIGGRRRQIRSLDNDLPRLSKILPGEDDIGVDQQVDERLRGMELVHRHIESDVTSPRTASLEGVSTLYV
jgi:hypothetical protein